MLLKSLIISTVLLAGCCAPVPKPPKFDSYLTSECTTYALETSFKNWEDVLKEKARNKKMEEECRNKHNALLRSLQDYMDEFNATK
jgi:hypothetical protein